MKPTPALPEQFFPVVLVGLPGAGKTTTARELSRLLGGAGVDLDSEIKRRTRMSIDQIFATKGEDGFRTLEHDTLIHALRTTRGVVALGGGTLERRENRDLLRSHVVIYLRVKPTTAAARVGDGDGRPLFAGADTLEVMRGLAARRCEHYRQVATLTVDCDAADADSVARRCYRALHDLADSPAARRFTAAGAGEAFSVTVGAHPGYRVAIGHALNDQVAAALRPHTRRAFLVYPEALETQADALAGVLAQRRVAVTRFVHPEGEGAKTAAVMERAWDALGRAQFSREDAVVSLGGGATTDVGGFIAATWLRGIDSVAVPTSLLGMVDAAVGGKTGINTPIGKNLVGAFYPPRAVIADLDHLATLPRGEYVSGLAEVVKCGFIEDQRILALAGETAPDVVLDASSPQIGELVHRAVAVKARVVTADLRESGLREILNYGHTLAHALEKAEDYRMRHGDAVAIGMVFAAEVAQLTGLARAGLADAHRAQLQRLGLPVSYYGAPFDRLLQAMRSDKKVRGDTIRMVLLRAPGDPVVNPIRDTDVLRRAAARVCS